MFIKYNIYIMLRINSKENMMIFNFSNFLSSPKPKARQTPDPPRNLSTQMFFEFVKGGCQLSLSRKAVPDLGTSKGKGFLSFDCVFLGNQTSVFVLRRLREEHALFFIEEFTKVFWGKILQGF